MLVHVEQPDIQLRHAPLTLNVFVWHDRQVRLESQSKQFVGH